VTRARVVDLVVVVAAIALAWPGGGERRWTTFRAPELVEIDAEGLHGGLNSTGERLVAGGRVEATFRTVSAPRRIEAGAPRDGVAVQLGTSASAGASLTWRDPELSLAVRLPDGSPRIESWTRAEAPRTIALRHEADGYVVVVDGEDVRGPTPGRAPEGRALARWLGKGASVGWVEVEGERSARIDPGTRARGWAAPVLAGLWAVVGMAALRVWWARRAQPSPAGVAACALVVVGLGAALVHGLVSGNRERLLEAPPPTTREPFALPHPTTIAPGRPLGLGARRDGDFRLEADLVLDEETVLDVFVRAAPNALDRQILVTLSTHAALPGGIAVNTGLALDSEPTDVEVAPGATHRLVIEARDEVVRATLDGGALGACTDVDLRAGRLALMALAGRVEVRSLTIEPADPPRALVHVLALWIGLVVAGVALGAGLSWVAGGTAAGWAAALPLGVAATFAAPAPGLVVAAGLALVLAGRSAAPGRLVLGWLAALVWIGTALWAHAQRPPRVSSSDLNQLAVSDVRGPGWDRAFVWARHPLCRRFNGYVREQTFRGALVARPKAPGTTRIVCLGSSSTNGYGVAADETFTHALGRRLASEGFAIETINAGVPRATAEPLRAFLEGVVLPLRPDVVVVDLGFNDHVVLAVHDERAHFAAMSDGGIGPLEAAWASWRAARARGDYAGYPRRLVAGDATPAERARFSLEPAARFGESLTDIVAACRAAGARVVLVEEPVRRDVPREPLHPFRDAMAEVAERTGAALLRPEPVLDAHGRDVFVDVVHPNPRGHWLIAVELATLLQERGWVGR